MNEHEWKKARDPEAMLAAVQDRLSERKWVLLNCAVARRMSEAVGDKYPTGFIDHYEIVDNPKRPEDAWFDFAITSVLPDLDFMQLPASPCRDFFDAEFNFNQRVLAEQNSIEMTAGEFFGTFPDSNEYGLGWEPFRQVLSTVLYEHTKRGLYVDAANHLRTLAELPETKQMALFGATGARDKLRTVQKQLVLDMNKAMRNYAKPANELLAHFLHEQLGNPFQPYEFDPAWRTADVMGLARGIEADRGFDRMNMLADALMEAGCEQEPILLHLQEEREHQRGCWVLDLILGHDVELFARPPLEDVSGTGGRHEPLGLALPRNWDV